MKNRIRVSGICAVAILICGVALLRAQSAEEALRQARRMLAEKPFAAVRDSVTRLAFTDIIPGLRYRQSQDMYVLGTTLRDKAPGFFLGALLRGYYLAEVSTDRRGHERAKRELLEARRLWPLEQYTPRRENLDDVLSAESPTGARDRDLYFTYQLTRQYVQFLQQLADEHLELNEAREAHEILAELAADGYASDMYTRTKLSWIFFKYRAFPAEGNTSFLLPDARANMAEAVRLAREDQARIAAATAHKRVATRYWNESSDLEWYHNAATSIISIVSAARWELDSAIVYYEMMPEWMKIRNNGIYLYLADLNYRMAERQFEAVGKVGNDPLDYVSQPSAIDAYVTLLHCKGAPEEGYAYLDDYTRKYQEQRGWGLISTGTANYWNGHLDASMRHLTNASEYPEIFGNISLTRTNYDLVIEAQRALTHEAIANRLEFEPAPGEGFFTRLWNAVLRFFNALWHRFAAFLARNTATDRYLQIRDRGEYLKVFYVEATGDPFQITSVLRGLDPRWHLERVRALHDDRPRAAKFRRYLEALFLHEDGRDEDALRILDNGGRLLRAEADTAYEKQFMAMTDDLHIDVLESLGMDTRARIAAQYRVYPQTTSLWGRHLPLYFDRESVVFRRLDEAQRGAADEALDVFARYGFDFLDAPAAGIPRMRLEIEAAQGGLLYRYSVEAGGTVIAAGEFSTAATKNRPALAPYDAAKHIAYGIFRIHERETGASASTGV
ncbi:MAG: hypothetical protein HY962_10395 [Ignavibacteriae bacterium]|nr:hypothetical protein [Ignavibacteriota bacterium]